MMKFTVEWNDRMHRWDVVRWSTSVEGARVGTIVDHYATQEQAEEICAYHMDMMNPALWADVGCKFDREIA